MSHETLTVEPSSSALLRERRGAVTGVVRERNGVERAGHESPDPRASLARPMFMGGELGYFVPSHRSPFPMNR
jgi:hypothetical protein